MTTDALTDQPTDDTPTLTPEAIATFWRDLAAREDELNALLTTNPRDFVDASAALLQPYAPGLAMEVLSRSDDQPQHLLVITAHGNIEWFEPLMQLVQAAPVLKHFTVTAFRARMPGTGEFVMGMDGFDLATSDVLVRPRAENGSVALELGFAKPIPDAFFKHAQHMVFIMLDHLLGEFDFAVRVDTVDWLETLSAQDEGVVPLPQLPTVFDTMRRDELGYSGRIVPPDDCEYGMLQGESDGGTVLVRLNRSACSTATRADMGVALHVHTSFDDSASFERTNALEDSLTAQLAQAGIGVLALVRTEIQDGQRQLIYYVNDEAVAHRIVEQAARDHHTPCDIERDYDPAWDSWRYYLSAA